MPTPTRIKKPRSLVENDKTIAESFLLGLINKNAVPVNFSGLLTPRFGEYIRVWQYDKGKLVGSCIIHQKNCMIFARKIQEAETSLDWAEALNKKEEPIGQSDPVNTV